MTATEQPARRVGAIRPLLRYLRPHIGKLLLATVALSFSSALFFLIGVGLSRLTDLVTQGKDSIASAFNDLIVISYIVLAAYAFGLFVRTYLMRWIGDRIGTDLRRDVFSRLARLGPSFYDRNPYAEIQSRISADTAALQAVIGSAGPNGAHNFVLLLVCGGYATWLSWQLSVLVLACIPVIFAPSYIVGNLVTRLAAERQNAQARTGAHVSEMLRNAKLVQAYRHEDTAVARYSGLLDRFFGVAVRNIRVEAWVTTITSLLSFGALTLIIWLGGHLIGTGQLTMGNLIAFIFYAHVCVNAAAQLVNVYMSLLAAGGAAARLIELRDHPLDARPINPLQPRAGDIVLDDVHFHYPTRPERAVLNGLDLRIAEGESVALVGSSGAGKSTLFDLILGFYTPTEGSVQVAGDDLRTLDRDAWLDRVSFVPQNPELLSGSVIDNLRLGRPEATEEEIWQALEHAAIADFVRSLPQGLDTDLGQDAVRLSGGQRQRLAIARALVRRPAVLLLDEPTSALDAESEAHVRVALKGNYAGLTTLTITHRIETAMQADRIVMLHHGRVLAEGTHQRLLATSPEYASLVQLELDGGAGHAQLSTPALPELERIARSAAPLAVAPGN
jgi:ATP-binding cassette, subfamily B, bacterial